jgi:hypothetical protein
MQAAQCLLGRAIGGWRGTAQFGELTLQTAVLFDELSDHLVERIDQLSASDPGAASCRLHSV